MPSRTSEFKSCVESARLRLASGSGAGQNKAVGNAGGAKGRNSQRSEFARGAAQVAQQIQSVSGRLEQLATLARRKTIFDDKPVEISELTYIIKRDIAGLNGQIAKLQQLTGNTRGSAGKGKQAEEHNSNVLVMLQGQLASTSLGFKDVLEVRTQNMKASKTRTEQFGYTSSGPSGVASSSLGNGPPSGQCQTAASWPQ